MTGMKYVLPVVLLLGAGMAMEYYPGNQDPHKSLQPIRSSNSQSRLPRDQRSTTKSTEIRDCSRATGAICEAAGGIPGRIV